MIEVQKINGIKYEIIRPFKILNIEGEPNWAAKVPVNIVFQLPTAWGALLTVNSPGIPHGTGDYIVCGDCGGVSKHGRQMGCEWRNISTHL